MSLFIYLFICLSLSFFLSIAAEVIAINQAISTIDLHEAHGTFSSCEHRRTARSGIAAEGPCAKKILAAAPLGCTEVLLSHLSECRQTAFVTHTEHREVQQHPSAHIMGS